MTDEQIAAHLNVAAVMANATIQGMIADNQRRESEGYAQAYDANSFFEVRYELESLLASYNIATPEVK